ncbi:1,4-alpha-glucan branching protein [Streptomyces sp. NPDC006670]|uniref:maltokinase N-terminal cap-like domain-containing protein n=1 Tax=Streptomyces sp. NPDC006670 TaxID=3154476 RepID=UPI0033CF0C4F
MAVIHRTTMNPGKLELLAGWLPSRPWYTGASTAPELARAGGFRIDDPAGEVGIEFVVVTDASAAEPVAYLVPLTYRGAPLEGAEEGLVGTSEHGVLGTRWIYDGAHDPVLTERLIALLRGEAQPQHQSVTGAPDPTVVPEAGEGALPAGAAAVAVEDGPEGTRLVVEAAGRRLGDLEVVRVLEAGRTGGPGALGRVTAEWELPDGTRARGAVAVLREG